MPEGRDMTWADALPTFDVAAVPPLFDELAGSEKDAAVELPTDYKLVRRAENRRLVNALQVANAARHLSGLPDAGESWHMVTKGNYAEFDFIPAVLDLARPATIRELGIATLGFSANNLETLLELLDAGHVGRVEFLYSVYFRSVEKESCQRLQYELTRRRQRVFACRTHAKILLMELSDGRCLVNESSANLRSCRNVEQSVLTHDRPLLEFHRAWMRELFDRGKA